MSDLVEQILEAGLVQFGLFGGDPIRVNLQLLPSYPVVLQNISRLCADRIHASQYERLLCG